MKKGGRSRFPDLNKDGKITMADILKGRGVGRRKRKAAGGMYVRPGKQMGVGGALLTLGKNIAQGKKLGSGVLKGVGRAAVTPGSGVGAGLGFAGALAGKSKNPALQKLGQGLGVAGGLSSMLNVGGGGLKNIGAMLKGSGAGGGMLKNIASNVLGGQGGGAGAGILQNLAGKFLAEDGMKVSYEDGGKMSYGHGGSMMEGRKPMLIIKMNEGGITDPVPNGNGNGNGDPVPADSLVAVASDLERRAGLAGDDGAALTGRLMGGTTEGIQELGSTIGDPSEMTMGVGEGTIASYNTEAVSPDMSQEQFELAMQSPFVAKQFEGMDIQNPEQLSKAYEGFKSQAVTAIRENEAAVANKVRELAKTNDNYRIKLEDLGENPTDKQIADMMVDENTDGFFGDLHGAVVNQFLPSRQLNPSTFPSYQQLDKRFVSSTTINGQTVSANDNIFTSIQDKGIKNRGGMEKLFQDATDAGIDLTKKTIQTEDFLRGWYTDSANADFIVTGQGAERTATGGTGVGDIRNPNFLNTMFKDAMVEENSTVPSMGQMGQYRQILKTRGQEAADAFAKEKGFDPSRHNRFAMGGAVKPFRVLKR